MSFEPIIERRAGVQDRGSQLVVENLLATFEPGLSWLDMCAGPGGKAAYMFNSLVEIDSSAKFLANEPIPHRADLVKRVVNNFQVVSFDGTDALNFPDKYDRILIDAPCTGLGALRSRLNTLMESQIYINPSILNANLDDLENEISRVASTSDLLHLDIMDNIFVPNFTFNLERAFEIINFSKLPVDAHLMINNPDEIAPLYAENGCTSVTFHFEAVNDVDNTIKDIRSNGAKVGLAIKPATNFADIEKWIEEIDMLLIMTVEPGFGGQSFMHEQMPKVVQARTFIEKLLKNKPTLQIDGGVSLETIAEAANAGANCFVAGSAVYKSDNPAAMVSSLRSLAQKNYPF
jgi:ribulose-phosphate 3-epimerase